MWQLLSSYSICPRGQNQVNVGVHLAIREQRNEAQRLGIGEDRGEKSQKFAQGGKVVRISHKWIVLCEFRTMHYSLVQDAKLWFFQMAKIFGF